MVPGWKVDNSWRGGCAHALGRPAASVAGADRLVDGIGVVGYCSSRFSMDSSSVLASATGYRAEDSPPSPCAPKSLTFRKIW